MRRELRQLFAGDIQTRVLELDGWLALGAQLPPKERRGLVLVDPPFEEPGEFERMADALAKAHHRWPGGVYALWYPVKNAREVAAFRDRLKQAGIPKSWTCDSTSARPRPSRASTAAAWRSSTRPSRWKPKWAGCPLCTHCSRKTRARPGRQKAGPRIELRA